MTYAVFNKSKIKHIIEGNETACGLNVTSKHIKDAENVEEYELCGNCARTANNKEVKDESVIDLSKYDTVRIGVRKHIVNKDYSNNSMFDRHTFCNLPVWSGDLLNTKGDYPLCITCVNKVKEKHQKLSAPPPPPPIRRMKEGSDKPLTQKTATKDNYNGEDENLLVSRDAEVTSIAVGLKDGSSYGYTLKQPVTVRDIMSVFRKKDS